METNTNEQHTIESLAELLARRAPDVAALPFSLTPQAAKPRPVQHQLFDSQADEWEARR